MQDHSWVWPACETLHFVGLCQLFGVVLIGNLRMLGVGKALLSFADLYQLLPLGMLGFTLNLITGMMFFVATPGQYTGFLFLLKNESGRRRRAERPLLHIGQGSMERRIRRQCEYGD